ncbi:MAG: hypothetical protein GKR96_09000 [Gammaproteobacteria bacterium]|nr:hypothetical protein [Gammaproteobacteria bacterium]
MVPPLNLLLGVAIGAAGIYIYKDESARQKLAATGGKVKEGVSSGAGYVKGLFKKDPEAGAKTETGEKTAAGASGQTEAEATRPAAAGAASQATEN